MTAETGFPIVTGCMTVAPVADPREPVDPAGTNEAVWKVAAL